MMMTEYGSLLESLRQMLNVLLPVLLNTIVLIAALGWFVSRRADAASLGPRRARHVRAGHASLTIPRREIRS